MTLVGWIVIAGAVIWIIVIVLGWLLSFIASFSGGVIDSAELGATKISDILGKRHLARVHNVPESLITLEAKLKFEDDDLKNLKNYEPNFYSPGPLEKVTYKEELPKLFSRVGLEKTTIVNIDDVRSLVQISSVPAYELLRVVSEEPAPKFPHPPLPSPRPVAKPQEWTPWTCKESEYEVTKPLYSGVLKPLNYFVEKSFKKAAEQAELLKYRESEAIEKATQRNKEVEKLYQDAIKKYEKACQLQEKAWSEIQAKDKQRVDDFFTAYSQEKQKIEILVSLAKSSSSEGLLARAEQTLKLESYPSFVPSDFALRFDEASKILILEHEFPDIGSVNWVKLVSQASQSKRSQRFIQSFVSHFKSQICLRTGET